MGENYIHFNSFKSSQVCLSVSLFVSFSQKTVLERTVPSLGPIPCGTILELDRNSTYTSIHTQTLEIKADFRIDLTTKYDHSDSGSLCIVSFYTEWFGMIWSYLLVIKPFLKSVLLGIDVIVFALVVIANNLDAEFLYKINSLSAQMSTNLRNVSNSVKFV